MRKFSTGVATLALIGTSLVVAAAPGHARGKGRHGDGPGPAAMKQQLGLSDEQAAELQKLRQQARKQGIRRRADIQIARLELDEALAAAAIDEKLVAAKVQALSQLQAEALQARVEHRLAVAKVLTPEQRAKMKELKAERRDRGRGAWGRTGAGPAGRPPRPTGPAVIEGER